MVCSFDDPHGEGLGLSKSDRPKVKERRLGVHYTVHHRFKRQGNFASAEPFQVKFDLPVPPAGAIAGTKSDLQ